MRTGVRAGGRGRRGLAVVGADLRAALVASCLRGALPPVDLRAVCLVRAMVGCFVLIGERAAQIAERVGSRHGRRVGRADQEGGLLVRGVRGATSRPRPRKGGGLVVVAALRARPVCNGRGAAAFANACRAGEHAA